MFRLKYEALCLTEKSTLTSCRFGRSQQADKSEPTVLINDCDIYLYEDKIHVTMERGLLLAADYIKLCGILDEQPVRFNGTKPLWMEQAQANYVRCRVLEDFSPDEDLQAQYFIQLLSSFVVEVYERWLLGMDNDGQTDMVYGMQLEDKVRGLFPYNVTCRIDGHTDPEELSDSSPDPNIIDWTKFDYDPVAARATAQQSVSDYCTSNDITAATATPTS